ncbi:FtsX-like permease family protein [Dactylosporangium sp. CS-033363]|uniref:FtsX-like permease family protein n=1 Tax=Dactylosporangium sp. CS-033363 TaxID=3239935 RepID=UPI003D8DFD7D
MLGLVLSALRARAAQAWAVFVLAVLLVTAAAAGPWFAAGAERRAAAADVAAAPASERTVSVRRQTNADGDPEPALAAYRDTVERLLPLGGAAAPGTVGIAADMLLERPDTTPKVAVVYREGACDHLRIDGRCPAAAGEVLLSTAAADALGLRTGDTIALRNQPRAKEVPATVVGRYDLADAAGSYWGDSLYLTGPEGGLDPVFTAVQTFESAQLAGPTFAYTAELPESAFTDAGSPVAALLRQADFALGRGGLTLVAPGADLASRIAADRAAIRDGVLAGALGAVVLCWCALMLAGRQTARDRRGDAGLLKLRGGSRGRALRLGVGQLGVPLVAGLPPGLVLGWCAGRLLGGPAAPEVWLLAGAAAGAAVLGGLAALAAGELGVLRAPVAVLLRRVPSRSGARRAAADVALVVLAGFAAAQLWGTGLRTAVPLLVAVIVAVAAARILAAVASRAGSGALRAGRLRAGLAAVSLSRQPGADRLMALVAVAVAGVCAATGGLLAGYDARDARAAQELGAPRVLTVRAANPTALLDAVRRADPGGRAAMAAVVDRTSNPAVLAVDASRLDAVAGWPAEPPAGRLNTGAGWRAVLKPRGTGAEAPAVTGGRLVVRARNGGAEAVRLAVVLQNTVTGKRATSTLAPIEPGEHEAGADVTGCAEGCRLVRLDLLQPPADATLTITGLRQEGPAADVLGAAFLGDPRQWRGGATGPALQVSARQGALTLTVPADAPAPDASAGDASAGDVDARAYVMSTALPLPAVLAGPAPPAWRLADPTLDLFGGAPVPVHVAATAPLVPVLGAAGVLVDLDAAQRLGAVGSSSGTYQVWLAAGAASAVPERLRAAGLTILGTDTVADRAARFASRGPAVAERFRLFAATLGLLAAAAALAVSVAAERRQRAADLRALRVQGLPARTASTAGRAGSGAVVLAGAVTGVLAAVVARFASGPPLPYFADGWNPPVPPDPLPPLPLLAAGVVALLLLAAVWRTATAGGAEGVVR